MVDGDVAALADELEGDGTADAGCAAGYGCCFAFEETPVGRCHVGIALDLKEDSG